MCLAHWSYRLDACRAWGSPIQKAIKQYRNIHVKYMLEKVEKRNRTGATIYEQKANQPKRRGLKRKADARSDSSPQVPID